MISFEAIRRLPLLLPTFQDLIYGTFYAVEMLGAKMMASHVYMPTYGALYDISFSGNPTGVSTILDYLREEFGEIEMEKDLRADIIDAPGYIRHYFFKSDCSDIPKTLVHHVLGDKRINQLMANHNLTKSERRKVHEILAEWSMVIGKIETKIQLMTQKCSDMPERRVEILLRAMLDINMEFAKKQSKKPGRA